MGEFGAQSEAGFNTGSETKEYRQQAGYEQPEASRMGNGQSEAASTKQNSDRRLVEKS